MGQDFIEKGPWAKPYRRGRGKGSCSSLAVADYDTNIVALENIKAATAHDYW